MEWSTMLVHTDSGNLNTQTRKQFIQNELSEKSNLTKGIKDIFCTTIGARMSQTPPMDDIGFRRPF